MQGTINSTQQCFPLVSASIQPSPLKESAWNGRQKEQNDPLIHNETPTRAGETESWRQKESDHENIWGPCPSFIVYFEKIMLRYYKCIHMGTALKLGWFLLWLQNMLQNYTSKVIKAI